MTGKPNNYNSLACIDLPLGWLRVEVFAGYFSMEILMFTYIENGEANCWIILFNKNWFMAVRFNGELMEAAQINKLNQMVEFFNRK